MCWPWGHEPGGGSSSKVFEERGRTRARSTTPRAALPLRRPPAARGLLLFAVAALLIAYHPRRLARRAAPREPIQSTG